jgi:hypothetical protein
MENCNHTIKVIQQKLKEKAPDLTDTEVEEEKVKKPPKKTEKQIFYSK